jgi:uncharacterized membrane protein
VREAIFLFIGLVTPVGILAVNGSAYVMQHLGEFRVGLAVSAFISNLFLQGLAVYAALRQANRRWHALYEEYRKIVIGLAVLGVVAWSAFGAWGTYVSMQSPKLLPNAPAVLISVWLLLLPIVTVAIGRFLGKRKGPGTRPGPS